jgi:prophage DNA circulation protein
MAWTDRLREAAYISPSGVRFEFNYEDVSRSFEKKTSEYSFPDAEGTDVQDMGREGRKYPMKVIIWGSDYDIGANLFEDLLAEEGEGRLEHPIYGVVDCVPSGTIGRTDKLKTAGNQAIISVTFVETTGIVYPSNQSDPAAAVITSVDEYNEVTAAEFNTLVDLDSATETVTVKSKYQALQAQVKTRLQAIADAQENVQKQFDAINDSITNGINLLITQPLTLAFQTTLMIQSPARALTSITARLTAYRDLAGSIITGTGAVVSPGSDSSSSNTFHTNDLYASTYVTGAIISVVNHQFETKPEAIDAAIAILDFMDEVTDWRDQNFQALEEVDTGDSYQQLQEAAALAAGFLVQISFTLKQERRIILDRNRTIIDLASELYGSIDDQLDFLINSNNLSGDEILELPKGREIVYYV